ncbi:MAG: VTT domain-containing protein [Chloroflexi bacterium]|nr:VTT domain-containing protein [Chloroflexota bacterium]
MEIKNAAPSQPRGKQILQAALTIGFSIAITVGILFFKDDLEQYAALGYPGIFLISVLGNATLILPVPAFAVVFATGAVLNPVLVGIAAGIGAGLGEMTGYLAGYGGSILIKSNWHTRIRRLMNRWGAWLIFFMALIPNPFFDIGGLVAGAMKMPWWKFLIAVITGKMGRFVILGLSGAWILR